MQEGTPRCEHCREVIGVYEPMVAVFGAVPVRTSRAAADPDLVGMPCFHADCFAEAEGGMAGR